MKYEKIDAQEIGMVVQQIMEHRPVIKSVKVVLSDSLNVIGLQYLC